MLLVSQSPFQLGECRTFFSLVRHVFQLGETCVSPFSAWWDMCLSWARHVSHLFQLGETCVSPFSIPGSNTGVPGNELDKLNFSLNSQCKRRLTWSPKRVAATNQKRLAHYALHARSVTCSMLACQGKGWWSSKAAFLSSRTHNLPSKATLRNTQTAWNVYMWMQQ